MKKLKAVTAIVLAAALCGCSAEQNVENKSIVISDISAPDSSVFSENISENIGGDLNDPTSSKSPESSSDNSSQTSGDPEVDENSTFLVGLAGDTILKTDITEFFSGENEVNADNFSKDNFQAVLCGGFTYLAEPSGICRTDRDNADVYDSGSMSFSDVSTENLKNYKRVNVGDTICGLTLTKAETNFSNNMENESFAMADGSVKKGTELDFPEIYFTMSTAEFDGELTLNGYICIVEANGYGVQEGDILFVPSDCECNLPVMGYQFDQDDGICHRQRTNANFGLIWQNEYGNITLGNISATSADISAIPQNSTFVKASVTIENIKMTSALNRINNISADIVEVEAAEF